MLPCYLGPSARFTIPHRYTVLNVSYRRRNPTREARLFPSLLGKIEMGFPLRMQT